MKNSRTLGEALDYCAKHVHACSLAARMRVEPDRERGTLLVAFELLLDRLTLSVCDCVTDRDVPFVVDWECVLLCERPSAWLSLSPRLSFEECSSRIISVCPASFDTYLRVN